MKKGAIRIATRGSALAVVQTRWVAARCRALFAELTIELEVIKTTGDKLQRGPLIETSGSLPRGLFTKELEMALLDGRVDLAVHSLKDLPTGLPEGLCLGAVPERADARDVLIVRSRENGPSAEDAGSSGFGLLPYGGVVGTSSTRRRAQLLEVRPDLRIVELRGNVGTRLEKLARDPGLNGTVLAAAGLDRLGIRIENGGRLVGKNLPVGLVAVRLEPETMLPCVGQGALGVERRMDDEQMTALCEALDHRPSHDCVDAERAFLAGMGGGCQSPVAAYAETRSDQIRLRGVAYNGEGVVRGEIGGPTKSAVHLGGELASRFCSGMGVANCGS